MAYDENTETRMRASDGNDPNQHNPWEESAITKVNSHSVKVVLMVLLIVAGIGMILMAFIVDWVGMSLPGFSVNQARLALSGVLTVLLAVGPHLRHKRIVDEIVANEIAEVRRLLSSKRDTSFALALFCVGVIVGTLYVSAVQSYGVGSFYAPTTLSYTPTVVRGLVVSYGLFLGVVLALAYGIFRLGMGRLLSILCTLFFMSSPIHLYNLVPSLWRDYAKVPFILAVVFILLLLVITPLKRDRLLILSTILGIVIGLGMEVRQDLIVFVIPFVVLVFFFLPGSVLGNIKTKVVALALFALVLLLLLPFLSVRPPGAGAFSAVGGFMTPFDARLGVTRPTYDCGYLFSDAFVWAISNAQEAVTPDYDPSSFSFFGRPGIDYLLKIGMNFPADVLTRTYAAVLEVLETPFTYTEPPTGITNDFIIALYDWRAAILKLLAGSGFIICFATLLIISTHSLRLAFFGLLLLLLLAGYPVLQFQGRHYFHLQFITWWCLGFVIQHTIQFVSRLVHSNTRNELMNVLRHPGQWWTISVQSVLMFIVGCLMIVLIPMLVLRQYQSWHVENLLKEYTAADIENLPLVERPIDHNFVLMTSPGQFKKVPQYPDTCIAANLLVAEFSNDECDYSTVWPVLRYESDLRHLNSKMLDFSRFMSVKLSNHGRSSSTRLFFPAIFFKFVDGVYTRFKGIEMTREQARCLQGLYRVKDPSQFPILLTATIPMTGEPYQTLTAWKASNIHTVPLNMTAKAVEDLIDRPLSSLTTDDISFQADIVHIDTDHWVVRGYATPQHDPCKNPLLDRTHSSLARASFEFRALGKVDTDLLISKDTWVRKGSYFIAQGELYSGGVTFGLIKDGRTTGYVDVTTRGPFTIIIQAPEDGLYWLGLANNLDMFTSLENRFVVTKAGWVKDIHD